MLEMADWLQPMAIQAGQKVKIHYQQGAIKVEAPGKAMKAANVGDKVVVLLDGQRQSMTARLGQNGDVYID
jgi:flagella basal body P-ring formation protein FlgA